MVRRLEVFKTGPRLQLRRRPPALRKLLTDQPLSTPLLIYPPPFSCAPHSLYSLLYLTLTPRSKFPQTAHPRQSFVCNPAGGHKSGHSKAERRDAGVAFAIWNNIVGRLPCLPQVINDRL
nr:unnamed protein product [Spirometra erinaceieuropaei]